MYQVSEELQKKYDGYYDEKLLRWRDVGAKSKAENIIKLCNEAGLSNLTILDCGVGDGSVLKYIQVSDICNRISGIDISDSAMSYANALYCDKIREIKKYDGYNIPYKDKEFDLVYCSHVIEHVEHTRVLLREIKRVSKYQIFEVPLDYSKNADMRIKYFLNYGHINIFTPTSFRFLLKSENFAVLNDMGSNYSNEVLKLSYFAEGVKITNLAKYCLKQVLNTTLGKKFLFQHTDGWGFSAYACLTKPGS